MPPRILVGLPYASDGRLAAEARTLPAPTLISAGSLFRRGGFRIGRAAWTTGASLDSAGYTAMKLGGYCWTPEEYVDAVVTNAGNGAMPFPWAWWSAMDYCVEPEIAADRGRTSQGPNTVEHRAARMRTWYLRQLRRTTSRQLGLFA